MKHIIISIILVLIFISLFIFMFFESRKSSKSKLKAKYDITYTSGDNDACLTFYKNGKYSMYDCDSEPTDYSFDSENECTYKINDDYIDFDCKYHYSEDDEERIKVLNWDDKEFKFLYEGKEETFKVLSK